MSNEQLSIYTDHIVLWHRYIDDVFMIWDSLEDLLKICLERLNKDDFNPTFTMSYDPSGVTFLDVTVTQDDNDMLTGSLYRKTYGWHFAPACL